LNEVVVTVDCCWRTAVLTAEEIWGWSTARIWAMRASWSRAEVVVVTVDTFWPELLLPKALPEPKEELVEPPAANLEAELPPAANLEAELPPAANRLADPAVEPVAEPPAANLEAEAPAANLEAEPVAAPPAENLLTAPAATPAAEPAAEPKAELEDRTERPAAALLATAALFILALFSSLIVTKPSSVSTVWV